MHTAKKPDLPSCVLSKTKLTRLNEQYSEFEIIFPFKRTIRCRTNDFCSVFSSVLTDCPRLHGIHNDCGFSLSLSIHIQYGCGKFYSNSTGNNVRNISSEKFCRPVSRSFQFDCGEKCIKPHNNNAAKKVSIAFTMAPIVVHKEPAPLARVNVLRFPNNEFVLNVTRNTYRAIDEKSTQCNHSQ